MTAPMLPIYKARIRFKIGVQPNERDARWRAPGTARDVTDHIIALLDDSNPMAMCGCSWQDIYYALARTTDHRGNF